MPHLVLAEGPALRAALEKLPPQTFRGGEYILALKRAYLSLEGDSAVIRCVLVEPLLTHAVYFVAGAHEEGLILKVDGAVSPLRTDGVKWSIARLGVELLQQFSGEFPRMHIARTNLGREVRFNWKLRGGPLVTQVPHRLGTFVDDGG